MVSEKFLILDFGSQYTQLIARRLRELQMYCEIWPFNAAIEDITAYTPKGIILSGGPESVTEGIERSCAPEIFDMGVPILGICYGMQLINAHFGGEVITGDAHEFGYATLSPAAMHPLLQDFDGLSEADRVVWMSHQDRVDVLPKGFDSVASSAHSPHCVIAHEFLPIFGLQFHPEVTHSRHGLAILKRFCGDISGAKGLWQDHEIIQESVDNIRVQVGSAQVLLGLSGGVDSTVAAMLLKKAIGDQLICVFVDTGLLRAGEADKVMRAYEQLDLTVHRVDAADQFYDALQHIDEPEAKRKAIGKTFIDIFEQKSKSLGQIDFLAQGTIYPDVIESAGSTHAGAKVIKSHHNVGGLPERMKMKLVEPLKMLFKDEVRKIGLSLGIPKSLIGRHPFPGPGLGVRILGEINQEKVEILQQADDIFITALKKHELYDLVSQAFAVFLPVKSVGVVGDNRRYAYVIALRAVKTQDFMTATAMRFDYDFLESVGRDILSKIPQVSRVVYDITSKPPGTIEWE